MTQHGPAPLIEEHYHIKELIDRQEIRAADRQNWKDRESARRDAVSEIAGSKEVTLTDFWCERCRLDFKAVAQRQIEEDWTSDGQIAFYKTKCFRGHWCIRLITDKVRDPYWRRSRAVAKDRAKHSADLIQPFEEGFNLLYGKPKHI